MSDRITFNSPDELAEWLYEGRRSLAERPLADEQQALGWGDHAVRFMDGLVIFVRVMTEAEIAEEDPDVRAQVYANAVDPGLMFAECFSVRELGGDIGSPHRSVLWPITDQTYDEARRAEWDLHKMDHRTLIELELAYQGIGQHLSWVAEQQK